MARKKEYIPVVPVEEIKVQEESVKMSKLIKIKTSVEGSGKFCHNGEEYNLVNGIIEVSPELASELLKVENEYFDFAEEKKVIVKPFSKA